LLEEEEDAGGKAEPGRGGVALGVRARKVDVENMRV
jgi:hypothetical protein